MLLSFCAKKVTKEGAFTGGVAILPPFAPLQTPKGSSAFGIPLSCVNLRVGSQRGSLGVGLCVIKHSGKVCRSDMIFLHTVIFSEQHKQKPSPVGEGVEAVQILTV